MEDAARGGASAPVFTTIRISSQRERAVTPSFRDPNVCSPARFNCRVEAGVALEAYTTSKSGG
jgi:hypothetical protein